MRLYVQRIKGTEEPIDRFFSHSDTTENSQFLGMYRFYHLINESDFDALEIGESKSFSGTTELVRIA